MDHAAASPLEPEVQPVATPVVAERAAPAVPPAPPLDARVHDLERALKESRSQALALKSEVATLVRLVGDIRKQVDRPAVAPNRSTPASKTPLTTAVAGLILGVTLGVFGWQYLSGEADVTLAPATPVAAQALIGDPPPAVQPANESDVSHPPQQSAPAPSEPQAPKAPRSEAPQAPKSQAPQAPSAPRTRYVGTLSVDADPGGEVFVNRKSAGMTPVRLTNLRAGSHLIWIERDGYRRFTRVVQVPADRVTRLSADLEPLATK